MLNMRPYNNKEQLLFPASIGDFIPQDDLVHVIDEAVESIDLTPYYRKISPVGNPPYDPCLLIKVWFYGYSVKTYSSRKIEDKLNRDVGFIYLAGMQKPDFRTISDFRKNNLNELKNSFVDILKICHRLGMTQLGNISIDSKVMKANASANTTYTEKELIEEQKELEKAIQDYLEKANQTDAEEDIQYSSNKRGNELPENIRDKKQRRKRMREVFEQLKQAQEHLRSSGKEKINLTDNSAQFQKDKSRKILGYRADIAVDSKEQVIVANDVTAEQADQPQLLPMIDEVIQNVDEIIQPSDDTVSDENTDQRDKIKVIADCGYCSGNNLSALEKQKYRDKIDPYIPDQIYQVKERTKKNLPFDKDKFIYDESSDEFRCPAGNTLHYIGNKTGRRNQLSRVYRYNSCKQCIYFGQCTTSDKGRTIQVSEHEHLFKQMREKLSTPEGKKVYGIRKITAEPVFGNLSQNLGFREFLLREKQKVKSEFSLMCTAHNLLKIARLLRNKGKTLKELLNQPHIVPVLNTS